MHGTHLLPELATALALGAVALGAARAVPACQATPDDTVIGLPRPVRTGGMPLAEAIARRRSVRDFTARPLSTRSLSQLCWAAQGITGQDEGLRAAPSAGALYPITIFVALPEAVHRYDPGEHALRRHRRGDRRAALRAAALGQSCVGGAPACMIVTIDVARSASKYGRWAERYCLLEAGHVAQNVHLQATALGLGAVPVGAFDDEQVGAAIGLPERLRAVYLLPVGHPADGADQP
ncbi:MAG: SagB/ThcOx family dehydrogenase [Planctomycetota bacterium]|jgi:SagB-type dehydrogenase family enzyme